MAFIGALPGRLPTAAPAAARLAGLATRRARRAVVAASPRRAALSAAAPGPLSDGPRVARATPPPPGRAPPPHPPRPRPPPPPRRLGRPLGRPPRPRRPRRRRRHCRHVPPVALAALGNGAEAGGEAWRPVATALAGPGLFLFNTVMVFRIAASWYPPDKLRTMPLVLIAAPTEPLLRATRRVFPPVGGSTSPQLCGLRWGALCARFWWARRGC
ncbi:hypothetical protein BU14_0066s0036 [Porphyra umbilicalis]|uniref:Uncharacterized protein n=1 Tax=Porphyra umbilicalis TaxID=2786 RepID=A0A1X6PH21_PORUM|nr:hypothetical protein BU14_0066s0036 [Porphyra umbilicalis]|eukprot:OSX79983.1 hypothetical protein BU14_0066s0036 [Porphyra umbilicalis]